jgi:uncharacterized integral membrane protein
MATKDRSYTTPSIGRIVGAVIVLLLFTLFVVQNAQPVRVRFFLIEITTQLAWALVLSGVLGLIIGLLLPRLRRFL